MDNFTKNITDYKIQWSEFLDVAMRDHSHIGAAIVASLFVLIFIISLTGNLLTCVVIYYDRTMHTATNCYLFNLAVSDLIVSFAILLEVYEITNYRSYQFGVTVCKLHFFIVVMLWNNSIMIMTALAIERYVVIWYPMLLNSTPVWRRVMKVILAIYAVAILETLPELWTVDLVKTEKFAICFTVPSKLSRIVNAILAVVTFAIPLLIMIFVYGMIAFKVNVTGRKCTSDHIFNHHDNRGKVNKLIGLTVSFIVCWLPFTVLRVLFSVDPRHVYNFSGWWNIWFKVASITNWFSLALNPILFSLMSYKFRKALKRGNNLHQFTREPIREELIRNSLGIFLDVNNNKAMNTIMLKLHSSFQ